MNKLTVAHIGADYMGENGERHFCFCIVRPIGRNANPERKGPRRVEAIVTMDFIDNEIQRNYFTHEMAHRMIAVERLARLWMKKSIPFKF